MASKQAKRTVTKRATEIKQDKVIKGTLATHNHASNTCSTASSSGIPLPQPEVWKVTSNTISYGCDFAGLGTMGVALDILFNQFTKAGVKPMPYKLKYAFACDILRASGKLIKSSTTPPLRWGTDILQRPPLNIERGQLGLYSFTSPCQGLSSAGKKLGASDPRTSCFCGGGDCRLTSAKSIHNRKCCDLGHLVEIPSLFRHDRICPQRCWLHTRLEDH